MSVHVIIGADDFQVAELAKKIIGDGLGLEVVDSLTSTNADLQLADLRRVKESVATPPFLDPKKTTWWKNVHFLPGGGKAGGEDGKKGVSADVSEAMLKFVEWLGGLSLPENQQFILSGPHLLKGSKVMKALAEFAELVILAADKPKDAERKAVARVIDEAQELGLTFAPDMAEAFVRRVGTDLRSLLSELVKMRTYLGPGEDVVTAVAIEAVTSPGVGVEPNVWGITDALGARDVAKVMRAVDGFEGESHFDVLLTTVVERFFRQLLSLKEAEASGQLENALSEWPSWMANRQRGFLRNWSLGELRLARARFFKLREQAVSGVVSDVLSLAVITLVRVCRRARR